jgi:predicted RNA binding protein YcfA (HicA-like mRNA interferase family)
VKIPRDLNGGEPVKLLEHLGYRVTRQTGSHMRLTSATTPEHHITIPRHAHLKTGTMDSILKEIAAHLNVSKEEVVSLLEHR